MRATDLLRQGDLNSTLVQLQAEVRADPSNAAHRTFLFQLCAVMGDWERAAAQLSVAGSLNARALPMVQTYRAALECEVFREAVFAGIKTPLLLGEPEPWVVLLIDALALDAAGRAAEAMQARDSALAQAPTSAGRIDGHAFEWIADGDSRLGPVCEAIINGKYYWIPFHRLTSIAVETPADLRDAIWIPIQVTLANGGQTVALMPTRYPGSERSVDDALRLARKTEWDELPSGAYAGKGQRMFATDQGEYALMDIRLIEVGPMAAE